MGWIREQWKNNSNFRHLVTWLGSILVSGALQSAHVPADVADAAAAAGAITQAIGQ